MKILEIQLILKIVITVGLTTAGVCAVSAHEGPTELLLLLGSAFIGVLLLAIISILETVRELEKEKK